MVVINLLNFQVEVKHAFSKEQQAQLGAKGLWPPGIPINLTF